MQESSALTGCGICSNFTPSSRDNLKGVDDAIGSL